MKASVTMRVGGTSLGSGFTTQDLDGVEPPDFGLHGVTIRLARGQMFYPYVNLMVLSWYEPEPS